MVEAPRADAELRTEQRTVQHANLKQLSLTFVLTAPFSAFLPQLWA
jgi:hypothetical protein